MKNKLRKAICMGLGLTQVLSSGAFAMSDYKMIIRLITWTEFLNMIREIL